MKGELGERLRESRVSLVEVFRNVGLRRVNLALAGSVVGDWAYSVAVSVYAFREGGATTLGLFGVARFLSMAVAAPLMSVLADRVDRRRLMVTVDLARAVLVSLAAIVVLTDGPALAVYALALTVSLLGTAFRPAQMALLPSLARRPAELTHSGPVCRSPGKGQVIHSESRGNVSFAAKAAHLGTKWQRQFRR